MSHPPGTIAPTAGSAGTLITESVAGEEDPGASLDLPVAKALPLAPGDQAAAGTPGTGEDVCPRCGGTGCIGETGCPDCAGTGQVIGAIGGG